MALTTSVIIIMGSKWLACAFDILSVERQEFSSYASKAVDRLMKNMVQTSNALASNKWLAGAKVIYEAVKAKRTFQGQDTKPFVKWAGIEQEVDRLVAGHVTRLFIVLS